MATLFAKQITTLTYETYVYRYAEVCAFDSATARRHWIAKAKTFPHEPGQPDCRETRSVITKREADKLALQTIGCRAHELIIAS